MGQQKMKCRSVGLFSLLTTLWQTGLFAQSNQLVEKGIAQIRILPVHYTRTYLETPKDRNRQVADAPYRKIIELGHAAIPALIDKLADTTKVAITTTCKKTDLSIGDTAFFLINDIEPVPYALVTKSQWCVFGLCSILPDGFLEHLEGNWPVFQQKYSAYLYGAGRKEFMKMLSKGAVEK